MAQGDNEVGAKVVTSENQSDFAIFAKKEERMRRKQERALRRERKAKRKLCLAAVTEGDEEIGLPAAGSSNIEDPHESQTEALEVEGGCTTFNNIGSTNGVAIRATELIFEMKMGQPATDGAARRAEEEEFEENLRENRRIERK